MNINKHITIINIKTLHFPTYPYTIHLIHETNIKTLINIKNSTLPKTPHLPPDNSLHPAHTLLFAHRISTKSASTSISPPRSHSFAPRSVRMSRERVAPLFCTAFLAASSLSAAPSACGTLAKRSDDPSSPSPCASTPAPAAAASTSSLAIRRHRLADGPGTDRRRRR